MENRSFYNEILTEHNLHPEFKHDLPDADLADAAAESGRTRTELGLYERADEAGEGEE